MRLLLLSMIFLLFFGRSELAHAEDKIAFQGHEVTPAELTDLRQGKILVWNNTHDLLGGTGAGYIPASPEKVFQVVTDYPEHPKFLPSILQSQILEQKENYFLLHTIYKSPWPFANVYMINDITHDVRNPHELKMVFKARKTNLKMSYGGWTVMPYQNGSLLFYDLNFDIHFIPQIFAASTARQGMRYVIEAMRERVQWKKS